MENETYGNTSVHVLRVVNETWYEINASEVHLILILPNVIQIIIHTWQTC
jgi:hypothetical protein